MRLIVGIAECAVSNTTGDLIVTHALGSCIAACIWDGVAGVGGMLHFLLPDSNINLRRAAVQPATFADTGLPLMLDQAYALGMDRRRCRVRLIGGADLNSSGSMHMGKRNTLAARQILWRHGLLIDAEATGGVVARTVTLCLADGRIAVTSGRDLIEEM